MIDRFEHMYIEYEYMKNVKANALYERDGIR